MSTASQTPVRGSSAFAKHVNKKKIKPRLSLVSSGTPNKNSLNKTIVEWYSGVQKEIRDMYLDATFAETTTSFLVWK